MPKYKIYAGLGGGFGGANYIRTTEETTFKEASNEAYHEACEIYESYSGTHGLFDREEALEEDPDLTDEDLDIMYEEYRESWIQYWIEEETEENRE
jgi:hypothetical protein